MSASLPDANNIHDMTAMFLDLYYRRFGPNKTSSEPLQPGSECGGWRLLIPSWIGQSTILDTAIKALAACFVGTQYQSKSLIDQAWNMYLSALQMVQQVLSEPGSAQRNDLLATTLVMSSIELFMSNGGGASQLTHIEGATRLLSCMTETQDFEPLHIYVLNQGLLDCISDRRAYHFSSPSYRSFIRTLYSENTAPNNRLYFQLCEMILPLPNTLAAADEISNAAGSSISSSSAAILSILDGLASMERSLAGWYETLKANVPGPWTFPAAQVSATSVPFPLQFQSIEACSLYSLYWMAQLLILETRYTLASQSLEQLAQMNEYASLVCRSVQFCTQGRSFASTENIITPLIVVGSYYCRQGDQDRMQWCIGAFARIAEEQKIAYSIDKLNPGN